MASDTVQIGSRSFKRIGFGSLWLSGPDLWGEPDDHEAMLNLLRRCATLGINFIDTADSYGPFTSETLIAEALYPYENSGVTIATKGGIVRPSAPEWNNDATPSQLRRACEGSLSRLRIDQIYLYQLHAPDPNVPFEQSVETLAAFQQEGLIQHVGLSNVNVDQLRTAQRIVEIVSVQNHYNLFDRSSEDVLNYCTENSIAFLPYCPLSTCEASGSSTENTAANKLQERIRSIAANNKCSEQQLALAWLLNHSPVMLPIPGTASVDHLCQNFESLHLQISEQDLSLLN